MIIRKKIDLNAPLTDAQKQMLEDLKTRPVQPDEDCPELTPEQFRQMVKASKVHHEELDEQAITLHLSPQALRIAKSFGAGYTSVLTKILENTLTDSELIKHYL